jgi:hypothetical protein
MATGIKGFMGSKQNTANPKEIKTHEGGHAYALNLEEKLCNAFTMGLIDGNFYTSQEEVIKAARDLFSVALKENPRLATQYALYGAEELGMKLMPTIWLVYLSTLTNKTLFQRAFPRIIGNNIKLAHDFVNLCRNSDIRPGGIHNQKIKTTNRGLGQSLKKTVNNWLYENVNEYNATRFTNKLEDICRLTRPEDKVVNRLKKDQTVTLDLGQIFKYVFKPKDSARRLTFVRAQVLQETIDILQNKERTLVEFQKALDNITAEKLQMDEIKFTFGKLSKEELKAVYMYFVPGLRYAALVTNLVAIERAFSTRTRKVMKADPMGSGKSFEQLEVLETEIPKELINIVSKKLNNFEDYKGSKLLFFRLLTAHEMVITSQWQKALNEVLKEAGKIAFADISDGRRIRCSADTSGSMGTMVTTSLAAVDVASYLTAAVVLSTPNTQAYATASTTKMVPLSSDSLIDCAIKIKQASVGHGTSFETLLEGYNGEDVVILVTDGQDSSNMERRWKSLTNRPKNSKLIIWHVVGWNYYNKIATDTSVVYLKGFNDNLFRLLSNMITGKAGQPEVVRNIKI